MRDEVGLVVEGLLVRVVSDSNGAIEDEVHLKNFLFLVIDHVLFFLLAEVAGFQAKGNIVQELAVLVCLRVEEEAEVVEDIVEEVVDDDTSLDLPRQSIDELIVLLHLAEPVVLPEVLEVLVDLPVQTVWQGLVTEPRQQSHPVVQIKRLLFIAQVLVEGGNNFDERAHDVREEGDACKHDEDAKDHLMARFG